ncbi:hypothetical protein [Sphingopyxis bauzanensis]|uniref:hypothetical protein n=1 Tax=Sphingopyxis bauzanensis TaxID=651663 RepID=UPI00139057ED|nr:hypothetical protein [Sphingopyxis bauzanensis]GGJ39904.1 hypothetical protein GCM10011393_07680 [Sphingopyxis bauzanensis]
MEYLDLSQVHSAMVPDQVVGAMINGRHNQHYAIGLWARQLPCLDLGWLFGTFWSARGSSQRIRTLFYAPAARHYIWKSLINATITFRQSRSAIDRAPFIGGATPLRVQRRSKPERLC